MVVWQSLRIVSEEIPQDKLYLSTNKMPSTHIPTPRRTMCKLSLLPVSLVQDAVPPYMHNDVLLSKWQNCLEPCAPISSEIINTICHGCCFLEFCNRLACLTFCSCWLRHMAISMKYTMPRPERYEVSPIFSMARHKNAMIAIL